MKSITCAMFSALFACICAGDALATDADNHYLILGPGAYSCQRIIGDLARDAKDKNAASEILYSFWLAGNLTGYNRATKGTYSILGDESFTDAFTWTVQYCHDHPNAIFSSAADALVAKLRPQRYAAMPRTQDKEINDEDDDDKDEDGK